MPVFAAIDLGANSVRLSIARFQGKRRTVIHEDREVTRLGASVFRTGRLAPEAMAQTVKVLRRFRRAAQKYGARRTRVVATSALRDAANARTLLDWVRAATGWRIEIISGMEEGRLIHLGVTNYARLRTPRVLLADLGGGSCEITLSVDGHIRAMHSLSLGAVRLTQEFLTAERAQPKKKEVKRLQEYVREQLERVAPEIRRARVPMMIATSGSAAAMAAMHAGRGSRSGGRSAVVTRAVAQQLFRRLARASLAERTKMPGVGPRRAEIILAGAAVFAEMLPCFGLRGFRYSPLGLRDGLLAQMAAEAGQRGRPLQRQIATERWDALLAMGTHYAVDTAHAARVRSLVLQLFQKLRPLHRLPHDYADWLGAAAMLQEVGNYVNRTGARRHGEYLIANSEIFGYTPAQRRLIAAIARYQSGPPPAAAQPELSRAVMLLRLARALDQGRKGSVRSLRLRGRGAKLRLGLVAKPREGDLELWALEKERERFGDVFGRELEITIEN